MNRWVLGMIGILAWGCAASPDERLAEIRGQLDEARLQGVERWAPEIIAEVDSLVMAATEEIDQQRARRFSVRSYRVARLLLDDADRRLVAARTAAEHAETRARAAADEKLERAKSAVARVRDLRRSMPRRPDTADDRAGIDADLAALESELDDARDHFGSGSFLEAADLADRVAARGNRMAELVSRSLTHDTVPASSATS